MSKSWRYLGLTLLTLFSISCTKTPKPEPSGTPALSSSPSPIIRVTPAPQKSSWSEIRSWAYQLQNIKIDTLAKLNFDLLVLEPYPDGEDQPGISPADLLRLQEKGTKVLAYLSIGEAESYRRYWKPEWAKNRPDWLEEENPDWPENFKVHYWHPEWQEIMAQSLMDKVEAGYDGVYFDLVDAYQPYEERGRKTARQEMIQFVTRLAQQGRKKNASFKIFVQNAEELSEDASFLEVIDGIGREEFKYGYENQDNQATPQAETEYMRVHLERIRKAGKVVLTVDYTDEENHMSRAREEAVDAGFIPYFAPRELDSVGKG